MFGFYYSRRNSGDLFAWLALMFLVVVFLAGNTSEPQIVLLSAALTVFVLILICYLSLRQRYRMPVIYAIPAALMSAMLILVFFFKILIGLAILGLLLYS